MKPQQCFVELLPGTRPITSHAPVFDTLLALPPEKRKREVHVVANDTLVESPLVVQHIHVMQNKMRQAAAVFGLPVKVSTASPDLEHTFWVNLIGGGMFGDAWLGSEPMLELLPARVGGARAGLLPFLCTLRHLM